MLQTILAASFAIMMNLTPIQLQETKNPVFRFNHTTHTQELQKTKKCFIWLPMSDLNNLKTKLDKHQ